jgi:hypothetical protein
MPELPGVPPSIGELYRSCLSEDPDDRPTAAAAAAVLLVALTVRTPQASDVAPRGGLPHDDDGSEILGAIAIADRRRRRRTAAFLGVGLVAVLAGTVFALATNTGGGNEALGAGPSRGASTSAPGEISVIGIPGKEVPVPGVGGQPVTVYVTVPVPGGGNQLVQQTATFTTEGGTVVAVCGPYGPSLTNVTARPGYYSSEVPLVVVAYAFFTKPAEGSSPAITYRLTVKCPTVGGVPQGTVTSYLGDKQVTPSPSSTPPTTAAPSPSA